MADNKENKTNKTNNIGLKIIYTILIFVFYFYAIRFLALTGFFPLYGSLFLPFKNNKIVGNIKLSPQQTSQTGLNITSITDYLQELGWVTNSSVLNFFIRLGFNILYVFYSFILTSLSGICQTVLSPIRILGTLVLGLLGWIFSFFSLDKSTKLYSIQKNIAENKWLLFGFHRNIYDYVYNNINKTWKYPFFETFFLFIYLLIIRIFSHLFTGNLQSILLYGMFAYIVYVFAPDSIYNIKLNNPSIQEIFNIEQKIKSSV